MIKLGIIGGGQLAMMLICAAKRLNIHTTIYCDDKKTPARCFANVFVIGNYDDHTRLSEFANLVDVVTFEFENIPYLSLKQVNQITQVLPFPEINQIIQHRMREKDFVNRLQLKTTEYKLIRSFNDILQYIDMFPCILKTCTMGYDGKGQYRINCKEDIFRLELELDPLQEYILEKTVPLKQEISVVLTRFGKNKYEMYEPIENIHKDQILRTSEIPAKISKKIYDTSQQWAIQIAEQLDYIGTLCVEYFIDEEYQLYVNEIAPRVHNSGHLTICTHTVNQFENHVRAICKLEQKETRKLYNGKMTNIIGEPAISHFNIEDAFTDEALGKNFYFDYKKQEARPGRKMGHFTEIIHIPT